MLNMAGSCVQGYDCVVFWHIAYEWAYMSWCGAASLSVRNEMLAASMSSATGSVPGVGAGDGVCDSGAMRVRSVLAQMLVAARRCGIAVRVSHQKYAQDANVHCCCPSAHSTVHMLGEGVCSTVVTLTCDIDKPSRVCHGLDHAGCCGGAGKLRLAPLLACYLRR